MREGRAFDGPSVRLWSPRIESLASNPGINCLLLCLGRVEYSTATITPLGDKLAMLENELRLGDTIDDYCGRCRLLMNHYIVSIVDGEVKKVRCQTCHNEHNFQQGQGGQKKTSRKSLFDQVASTFPQTGPPPKAVKPKKKKP